MKLTYLIISLSIVYALSTNECDLGNQITQCATCSGN